MPSSVASETEKIPKSSFEIYRTEGDALKRSGDTIKAIECYTKALEQRTGDQHCLVNRSKCYLLDGDITKALADAEESLAEDKNYHKGIFQKAEVLYFKADFENALVFYHRGNKLRPDSQYFRLGIQKAEEAINNAVGEPCIVTLKSEGDLTHFYDKDDDKTKKNKGARGYQKPKQQQEVKKVVVRQKSSADNRTVKQLLGTLYADREYLEKILKEEETINRKTENSDDIRELAIEGLNYLDSRSEFWQQQKPMYSRKYEQKQIAARNSGNKARASQSAKSVRESLDKIDEKLSECEFEQAMKQAKHVLKQVEVWSDEEQNNKTRIVSNLYSIIGNCNLEMGDFEQALEFHNRDLEMGRTKEVDEAVSRAMDNLGRVHAKRGEFQKAIDIWEEKIPNCESPLEMTWLSHEIGRCHLELNAFESAKEYGERSLSSAREISDDSWQLNANVLIAQACVKMDDNQSAIDSFEQALEFAKLLGNTDAEEAINKAIDDVNHKITQKVKEDSEQDNEKDPTENEGENNAVEKEKPVDEKEDVKPTSKEPEKDSVKPTSKEPEKSQDENAKKEDDPQSNQPDEIKEKPKAESVISDHDEEKEATNESEEETIEEEKPDEETKESAEKAEKD